MVPFYQSISQVKGGINLYQSIYRKYRPQTFDQVYGQDAISTTLKNAIVHDRIAHAYLFSGPRGTGKTSMAKLLAKAINCTNIVDGVICDTCENCTLIRQGSHPDVIEIDAASNNGVDDVRELIEGVKYAPIKGKKKVYIIDEVHMMSKPAFNALLKTLEEPPEHVCFILATTEIHKVMDTIQSRCQKFTFKKINSDNLIDRMKDILVKEDIPYQEEALEIIASVSDGGMRDALSTLEQVMIFTNNNINKEETYLALDLVSVDNIKKLYDLIKSRDLQATLDYINELNKDAMDVKQVMNDLIELAMNEIIAGASDKVFLLNLIEKLDESLVKLKTNTAKKLYLDLALIKAVGFADKGVEVAVPSQAMVKEVVIQPQPVKPVENKMKENYERLVSSIPIVEEKPAVEKSESIYSEEEIINVLLQASKEERDLVNNKWSTIQALMTQEDTKQAANLLVDTNVVAAGRKAIIVESDQSTAILINNIKSVEGIVMLMDKIYDNERFVFAVTPAQWKVLRGKFYYLNKEGTLPQPKPILDGLNFRSEKKEVVEEDDMLLFAKEVFGTNKLEITE